MSATDLPSHMFFTSSLVALRRQYRRETERLVPQMMRGDRAAFERAEAIRQQVAELYEWTYDLAGGPDFYNAGGMLLSAFEVMVGAGYLVCALDPAFLEVDDDVIVDELAQLGGAS